MADRNVTFLIIARDFASQTMKNVGDSTDRAAQKLRNLDTLGLKPLATAGAALGPALLPVLAGAAVGSVALGAAMVGAAAGIGVFGAVTKSVVSDVAEASKKSEDLRTKISLLARQRDLAEAAGDTTNAGKYEKARIRATYEYRARLAELPAPMRAAVVGMDSMRTSWEGFVASNRTPVLGLLARGSTTLARALPLLQPLFDVTAQAADALMGAFERFVGGGGLQQTVSYLAGQAGPAFERFGGIILSFGYGFGQLLAPFASTSDGVLAGLDRMSLGFARWARESGRAGVERILGFAQENGPGAAAAFGELAASIGTLAQAAAPLAPISAAVALALGQIINALPQPVLTALIGGFIAWNVALTVARVATLAMAGASRIMAAGTWAMNSALLASPITWVVLGLVALAAGLYVAYQRSATFRAIVQGALRGAVAAGRAVLDFFRGVPGFFTGVWASISGAFTLGTTWVGQKLGDLRGWFAALPGRVLGVLASLPGRYVALWRFVMERGAYWVAFGIGATLRFLGSLPGRSMTATRALPGVIWGVITSAFNGAKSRTQAGVIAVANFVQTLPGKAASAVSSLWSRMSGAFTSAWSSARSTTTRAVSDVVGFLRGLPGKAASAIASLPGTIKGVFSDAGMWLYDAGSAIVSGLVRGIAGAAGNAIAEAKRVAGSIVSGFKNGLGISSPSRVMADEVGRWIPPGILSGIRAATPDLVRSLDGIMGDVVATASPTLSASATPAQPARPVAAGSGPAEVLQPIQFVVEGRVLQQVLLKVKRDNGGMSLGLA